MSDRIRVTVDELRDKWFSPDARGMIHDHQTQEVVVEMLDGTAFACTFAEKVAADA